MGTFADGIANGMLENRAAGAESAASNARYAAADAERKLRDHKAHHDQTQALLIDKINRLSDDLRLAYDQKNVAVMVLRAIHDAMQEELPHGVLRESFRLKYTEKSYLRFDEFEKQGEFNDKLGWRSIASKMTSVTNLGIAKLS
jgi:hypothetical protein